MKLIVLIMAISIAILASSCSTFSNSRDNSRGVANTEQDYLKANAAVDNYFADQNFFNRLVRVEHYSVQFYEAMPDKGNAKKALLKQFITDLHQTILVLAADSNNKTDILNSWIPSTQIPGFNEKIKILGKLVQSAKVMDRMGIYLTASGVFEADSQPLDFYYTALTRVMYGIENELRNLVLIYPPEMKDTDENEAKLKYTKNMATDIRNNMRKVFQSNKNSNYKKLDQYFKKLSMAINVEEAKKLIKTTDFQYAKNVMQNLHIMNSGDIDGFQDEIDLTVATKFNFQMINELITSLR